jgi:hypothetical protein
VLEIGSSLREVRIRRGVELAQVEADTHIRTRYLKALEDERFDLLPREAYVRGFLRTYADYLELDADLFVDEYNARFAPPEEPQPVGCGNPVLMPRGCTRGSVRRGDLVARHGLTPMGSRAGALAALGRAASG